MGPSVEYCLILLTMGIATIMAAVAPNGYWNYPRYSSCEAITIRECYGIGYDKTVLAGGNKFGHTTQDQVRNDPTFQKFARMLQNIKHSQCSIDFRMFVCGVFLPRCVNGRALLPCNSTCGRVKGNCWWTAEQDYGLSWPEKMDCKQPYFVDSFDSCMMSIGDPTKDKRMMVMDLPNVPASSSLTQSQEVQFANCQCTCSPQPPCYTP